MQGCTTCFNSVSHLSVTTHQLGHANLIKLKSFITKLLSFIRFKVGVVFAYGKALLGRCLAEKLANTILHSDVCKLQTSRAHTSRHVNFAVVHTA